MAQRHVKRLAVPRVWEIRRKENTFAAKASPGAHDKDTSVPFTLLFRDMIGVANTTKEVKYLLNNKHVSVNGVPKKGVHTPVGLMDIVSISETGTHYRVMFNKQGKLAAREVPAGEEVCIARVRGKTKLKGNKTQLQLHNGANVRVDSDEYKTGDTLVISIKDRSIQEHIKLEKGNHIYLTGGRHIGEVGVIEDIQQNKVVYRTRDRDEVYETARHYAFVIGTDKPVITV